MDGGACEGGVSTASGVANRWLMVGGVGLSGYWFGAAMSVARSSSEAVTGS